jgi:hypothetical protein
MRKKHKPNKSSKKKERKKKEARPAHLGINEGPVGGA